MQGADVTDNMKVYRPKAGPPVFIYIVIGVLALAVVILGLQNLTLRNKNETFDTQEKAQEETTKEEVKVNNPETLVLNQQNPTEDWRIYKNLTYGYKFRVPKNYQARVNNAKNSVEIFNEENQRTIEVIAEPRSETNTGNESEKKEGVGTILYNVFEFPDGKGTIKTPHVVYKMPSEKYVFSLYFYNEVALDEMEKLILATFSEIEQ